MVCALPGALVALQGFQVLVSSSLLSSFVFV